MRVLITGGLGFVGSQLVKLLAPAHDITVLDNAFVLGKSYIHGDIRNEALLRQIVWSYDVVVHLAGIVGTPACAAEPDLSHDVNVNGTVALCNSLDFSQTIIFISSTTAYGQQDTLVTEDTPLQPTTLYSQHKAMGEKIVQDSLADWIIFRPATSFGTSDHARMDLLPNTFMYDALTKSVINVFEPHAVRPFIHVLDFARAIQYAIEGNLPHSTIYNLGDPALIMSKEDLAKNIAALTGASVLPMEGSDPDKRDYAISFDKLMRAGFTCSPNTLELGLSQIKSHIQESR